MNKAYRIFLAFAFVFLSASHAVSQNTPMPTCIKGQAVATCFAGYNPSTGVINDAFVVGVVDVHGPAVGPGLNWPAPMYHGAGDSWKSSNFGQVYGIAIDKRNNVFITTSTSYGYYSGDPRMYGPGGGGGIYRLDGITGVGSTFVSTAPYTQTPLATVGTTTLPNGSSAGLKPGLGNICYSARHDRLYVTNHEDGVIYAINALTGVVVGFYDPSGLAGGPLATANPAMAADVPSPGFAPLGERLWGVGYNPVENRIYYSVWMEDFSSGTPTTRNIIRSIGLTATGDFNPSSNDFPEIAMSDYGNNRSGPVSDIEFASSGKMLVGECSIFGSTSRGAHQSRVFQYTGVSQSWSSPQQIYVGASSGSINGENSSGGVDYGYGRMDSIRCTNLDCDSVLWLSGDFLAFPAGFSGIYGLQRTPASGNTLTTVQSTGYFIDLNGVAGTQDKTQIGDVDVFRDSCGSVQDTGNCKASITLVKKDTLGTCCWQIKFNNASANTFLNLQAQIITSGATFSTISTGANWNTTQLSTTTLIQTPIGGGFFPVGNLDVGTFCLNLLPGTVIPQVIEFTWTGVNGEICRQTLQVDCTPPIQTNCFTLVEQKVECISKTPAGAVFTLAIKIKNETSYPMDKIMITSPSVVTITPNPVYLVPPIPPGGTTNTLTFTISGPDALENSQICFDVKIIDTALAISAGVPYIQEKNCCIQTFCFTLPKCKDCCEGFQKTIQHGTPQVTQPILGVSQIATGLSAGPSPIVKFTATVVSADRKTQGGFASFCTTSGWTPVFGNIINPQASVGGLPLSNTPQPFATPPPAPYREAIWGTSPLGVTMSATPFTLQIRFPNPPNNPWFGCSDSLRFCVRYSFTDVNCRTCDTMICYAVRRTGQFIIIYDWPVNIPKISVIKLTSKTAGTLTIDLPKLPVDFTAEDGIRLTGVSLQSGAGVRVTRFDGATAPNFVGSKTLSLGHGEKAVIPITYDNYADQGSFINYLTYRYVNVNNPKDTLEATDEVLAIAPGSTLPGGDVLRKDDSTVKPTNVRTYALHFAVTNKSKAQVATVNISVDKDTKILATGPYEDNDSLTYNAVKGVYDGTSYLFPVTSQWATPSAESRPAQGSTIRPIYLTVAGSTGKTLVIHYVTRDDAGNILTEDSVTLSDPLSTVKKNDPPSGTRSSGHLYPPYPNPTASSTTLQFRLDAGEYATLSVLDALGNEVLNVLSNQFITGGEHVFNVATDNLPSGSYTVRLHTDSGTQTQRLTIIR